MKVVLIHHAVLPVHAYGGTERLVWWLSKALAARGMEVTLACAPGSHCAWAKVVHIDITKPAEDQLPGYDLYHYFNTPMEEPTRPHVVTIGGNGKPGEVYLRNTAFVSRSHARRHGAECFVYNGVDPDDYRFRSEKDGSLLFLAKASWRVKNVQGAIRIARKAKRELQILGGDRLFFKHWRGVHWNGMLGGIEKADFISRSSALLFPILWNEPFGLAVIEAMVSGTPVFATPMGSMPELIHASSGRLCLNDEDFLAAIDSLGDFKANDCREWALSEFSHFAMADRYLKVYERVLNGEALNSTIPVTQEPMEALASLPFQRVVGSSATQSA
jgi:glycosyltransferase involved in cell wall biosynthesis